MVMNRMFVSDIWEDIGMHVYSSIPGDGAQIGRVLPSRWYRKSLSLMTLGKKLCMAIVQVSWESELLK